MMNIFCNGFEAFWAVINGIHTGHDSQQCLCRADVGGGAFAFDVLLAGLERHPQRTVAKRINRNADNPARYVAFKIFLGGKKSGVRTAVTHRHTKTLARTNHNVGAPFAGRREQSKA